MDIIQKHTNKKTGASYQYWQDNILSKHVEENYKILSHPEIVDVYQIDKNSGDKIYVTTTDKYIAISEFLKQSDEFTIIETTAKFDEYYRMISKPAVQILKTKPVIEKESSVSANQIQVSTRRNIVDSFLITRISWFGRLEQPTFLSRLYDLNALPSYDPRYTTANEDIVKHTVINEDWPDEWLFSDKRFNLLYSSDRDFLDFLCMTLHPAVRQESEEITTLLEIYTNNLKRDGFTLEKAKEIGGLPTYRAVEYKEYNFEPEANQNKNEIRKALVIGCSNYQHAGTLVNPLNDADSMEEKLQKLGFEVVKQIDPSQKELKMIIDTFGASLKGSDIGLFYFAGHGVQVHGLNYLIPIDANLTSEKLVEYDCVEAGRILAHMEDAKIAINLIILDACRNNPFERAWGRGLGQRGLATMNAPKGSMIAYSTAPGKTASDGAGKNGLYTEALLNHIEGKSTPISTMFQKVRLDVMEKSKEEQVPWESTSLTSEFYFQK